MTYPGSCKSRFELAVQNVTAALSTNLRDISPIRKQVIKATKQVQNTLNLFPGSDILPNQQVPH
jgi:hypothetical protein